MPYTTRWSSFTIKINLIGRSKEGLWVSSLECVWTHSSGISCLKKVRGWWHPDVRHSSELRQLQGILDKIMPLLQLDETRHLALRSLSTITHHGGTGARCDIAMHANTLTKLIR